VLFHLAENNGDGRFARNGERWLVRELLAAHARAGSSRTFVAFDAGANVGDYTQLILKESRRVDVRAEVHAFEPSPMAAESLRRTFAGEGSVRIVAVALANQAGEATLFAGGAGSRLASLMPRAAHAAETAGAVAVSVERLDTYLTREAISRVDLLKLDVEGFELAALRGLGDQLRPEVVDVIQFEYGGTSLDAGATLRDLHQLLTAHGYVLAKLFPCALEARDYLPWMENYAYANYVALAPRWLPPRAGTAVIR
jgi:FkbM family methyltransferase